MRFAWVQEQAGSPYHELCSQGAREETGQAAATQVLAPENTQDEERRLRNLAKDAVGQEMPGLFEHEDLGERGVMIKTPIGYPHETAASVYLLQKWYGYPLTDHSETLEKLRSNHPEHGDPDLEDRTTEDTYARLRIEMQEGALTARVKNQSELADAALRLALAMFGTSGLARPSHPGRGGRAETRGLKEGTGEPEAEEQSRSGHRTAPRPCENGRGSAPNRNQKQHEEKKPWK